MRGSDRIRRTGRRWCGCSARRGGPLRTALPRLVLVRRRQSGAVVVRAVVARVLVRRSGPGYPLLLWVIGGNPRRSRSCSQSLALAAWGVAVGHDVARAPEPMGRGGGDRRCSCCVAVETRWIFWHTLVLTESLSATLRSPRHRRLVAVGRCAEPAADSSSRWVDRGVDVDARLECLRCRPRCRTGHRRSPACDRLPDAGHRPTCGCRGPSCCGWSRCRFAAYTATAHTASDRGEVSFHNNMGLRWLGDDACSPTSSGAGLPDLAGARPRTGGGRLGRRRGVSAVPRAGRVPRPGRRHRAHDGRRSRSSPRPIGTSIACGMDGGAARSEHLADYDSYTSPSACRSGRSAGSDPVGSRTVARSCWASLAGSAASGGRRVRLARAGWPWVMPTSARVVAADRVCTSRSPAMRSRSARPLGRLAADRGRCWRCASRWPVPAPCDDGREAVVESRGDARTRSATPSSDRGARWMRQ